MHAASDVGGETPRDLAHAAERAHRAAGSPRRRFVLALGQGLYQQRLLLLPTLSRREMDAILRRKAANLLACELEDALFAALKFPPGRAPSAAPEGAPGEGALESRWLLVAMRRSEIVPLLHQLRARGLSANSMVSAGLSIMSAVQRERSDRTGACIGVSIEAKSVSVGLMDGAALIQHHVLQGDFSSTPTMALAVLQEIKSCDAFWRKSSRGGSVSEVVLVGIPRERADLFVNAIHTALPRASVARLYEETAIHAAREDAARDASERTTDVSREDDTGFAGAPTTEPAARERCDVLAACTEGGDFQLDLTVPLPITQRAALLFSAAAVLVVGALGVVTYTRVEHRRGHLVDETHGFAAAASDLSLVRARRARAQESLENLAERADRSAAMQKSGWPLSSEIDRVFSAFGRDASVLSLSLGRLDQGGEVEIRGVTDAHPWRAVQSVKRITTSLAESALLSEINAENLSNGGTPSSEQPTEFTIKAHSSSVVREENQP